MLPESNLSLSHFLLSLFVPILNACIKGATQFLYYLNIDVKGSLSSLLEDGGTDI